MSQLFPQLNMAQFAINNARQFNSAQLISMHATNPQPLSQSELQQIIGQSFHSVLTKVNLGFTPDQGTQELRTVIASRLYSNTSATDVVTHAGAQEALFCVFHALLNPNDTVLIVTPVFEPIYQIPINIGCRVETVPLDPHNYWSMNLNVVESQFKKGCKMFVINFPHNPTGATLSKDQLQKIIALCQRYGVWLLSDEVFRGLEHDPHTRLPAVADSYQKGISIGVISKAYAVPGLRVGWMVCHQQSLRQKVLDVKSYLSICNSQVDEILVATILMKHEKILQRNRDIITNNIIHLKKLNAILEHRIDIPIPTVGCCAFALLADNTACNSTEIVNKIAKQSNYLLYPATLFKTKVNAVRIGFGRTDFCEFVDKMIRG